MFRDNNVTGLSLDVNEWIHNKALVKVAIVVKVHCMEPLTGSFILRREEITDEKILQLVDEVKRAA
jgi:hypothetical protein